MLKMLRRQAKPLWRSAALAFLWANRRDAVRWARFVTRAAAKKKTRPDARDLRLEAKVRAALSADPLLRQDPSIRDVRVRDGVVVLETPAGWHNKGLAVTRLGQVKGVESVHTASDVNETHFLDVDLIDLPITQAAR